MGLFDSKSREAKKREKQENIKKINDFLRKCVRTNRTAQIQHLDDYLSFPSIDIADTIVMAKLFCSEYEMNGETHKSIRMVFFDKSGDMPNLSIPIDKLEAARVLFKIIPFFIVVEKEDWWMNHNWWLHYIDWNHGSDYDCNAYYKGKTYLFAKGQEDFDSSIKSENDVFVQKDRQEVQCLPDRALLYLCEIIKSWKNNNFSEIVGDYNLWREKRDFILGYENVVNREIEKRGFKDRPENQNNYGAKGERDVEYALKWLPKEFKRISRTEGEGIHLLYTSVSEESQEIDHIVVAPNGVFLIETKYLKGNISIDKYGNWAREVDGIIEGIRNPVQQSDRHYTVVSSILDNLMDSNDIHNIICLAYDTCTIDGVDNCPIAIVKSDMIARYITECDSNKKYEENEIDTIIKRIEQYRIYHKSDRKQ